ncbi:MAG: glycosyltransferase family 4 protein [Rhodothermia bacterium]|nr:glycosyltransferase family 4 protein [Rhodothermia bacterium]
MTSGQRRIRVALVSSQLAHVNSGPGTFVNYLRQNENAFSFDLVYFSEDLPKSAGVREHQVQLSKWDRRRWGQPLRYLKYHRSWSRVHRQAPFDLVWYNDAPHLGLFSALGRYDVPVALMINDYNNIISKVPLVSRHVFGWKRSLIKSALFWLERIALRGSDMVIANSSFLKQEVSRAHGIEENKILILPKAVDTRVFRNIESGHRSLSPRILFFKSDFRRGGLADLLAALSDFSHPVEITVAGPHESREHEIRRLAAQCRYKGILHFVGRVPREEVPALYAQHSILCVPSLAEALGVVFLEGLASGTVTVGTNVGGIPHVLDGGRAGWLVEPRNAAHLRSTLSYLFEHPAEVERKRLHGLHYVEQFSVDKMLSRFEEFVERIIRDFEVRRETS